MAREVGVTLVVWKRLVDWFDRAAAAAARSAAEERARGMRDPGRW